MSSILICLALIVAGCFGLWESQYWIEALRPFVITGSTVALIVGIGCLLAIGIAALLDNYDLD